MRLILIPLLLLSIFVSAQKKIVFAEEYKFKNNPFNKKLLSAKLMEDSATKQKMLVVSGMKSLQFYQFDPNWKLLHKFEQDFDKRTSFKEDNFKIVANIKKGNKWQLVTKLADTYTQETVDFDASSHQVGDRVLDDINSNFMTTAFSDDTKGSILYLSKDKEIRLASFNKDLSLVNYTLPLNTQLPLRKSSKYSKADLYAQLEQIDSLSCISPYFTRKKVQFYQQQKDFAILIAGDEPVVELSWFNKQNGSLVKSDLFSVEELLVADDRKKEFNTAGLLFEGKLMVLAAHKSGGVFAVFDAQSKKLLFHKLYNEKDPETVFSYNPVTYETMPGVINLSKVREKVTDISMNKFCSEMFKHSCAITARHMKDNSVMVNLCNYDRLELAAPTSTLRTGINTMSSPLWFVSTTGGITLDRTNMQPGSKRTTWAELQAQFQSMSKTHVWPNDDNEEYKESKAYVLKSQFIGNKNYTIYYYEKELKIHEITLGFFPPKLFDFME